MKRIQFLSLVNSLFLFSNVCALTLKAPTMIEGLTTQGKEVIRAASDTSFTNVSTMDYAGDMGSYAVGATISLHQFLQEAYPEKLPHSLKKVIETTPIVGANNLQQEQFS